MCQRRNRKAPLTLSSKSAITATIACTLFLCLKVSNVSDNIEKFHVNPAEDVRESRFVRSVHFAETSQTISDGFSLSSKEGKLYHLHRGAPIEAKGASNYHGRYVRNTAIPDRSVIINVRFVQGGYILCRLLSHSSMRGRHRKSLESSAVDRGSSEADRRVLHVHAPVYTAWLPQTDVGYRRHGKNRRI